MESLSDDEKTKDAKRLSEELSKILALQKDGSLQFLKSIEVRDKPDVWRVQMTAPKKTLYWGMGYKYEIELNMKQFPEGPPLIRFLNKVSHFQLEDDGTFRIEVVNPWKVGQSVATYLTDIHERFFAAKLYEGSYPEEEIRKSWEHNEDQRFILQTSDQQQQAAVQILQEHFKNNARPEHRRAMECHTIQRLHAITGYSPLYPELFTDTWTGGCFDHKLVAAVEEGTEEAIKRICNAEVQGEIYSFDFFTPSFSKKLCEELKNFERSDLPKHRPNSMNKFGVILDDMGLFPAMRFLREKYISPISEVLFRDVGGDSLDFHHAFMVQYMKNQDLSLAMHVDDSEVTLNVCIGADFTGCPLTFCGRLGTAKLMKKSIEWNHKLGKALIHRGRHRHGAQPIESGERYNLIVWSKSRTHRQSDVYQSCGCHHVHFKQEDIDEVCLAPDQKAKFYAEQAHSRHASAEQKDGH